MQDFEEIQRELSWQEQAGEPGVSGDRNGVPFDQGQLAPLASPRCSGLRFGFKLSSVF